MSKQPKYKIDNSKLTRLVEKAKRGNQKAMEDVVNMVSGYIYYYSLTLLGDDEQAKDAVQDILLTMLKKLDSLEDPKAFLGWIKTVTANYCKSKLTRSKDNLSLDEGTWEFADYSDQICPSKSAETNEVCAYVREAVTALPQLLRESVMMFYFNQMSVKQIADVLEVNENTVKSRLHSARKTMKKYLEQYGGATLASGAVPPMSLLSYSLIQGAEQQNGILIPYVTASGEVKLTSVNSSAAAATSFPFKAAAAGAVCVAVAGAAGATAAFVTPGGGTNPAQIATTAVSEYKAQPTTSPRRFVPAVDNSAATPAANNRKATEPATVFSKSAQNQNYTTAAAASNAPNESSTSEEKSTTYATEPTEADEKITATFSITVNRNDFSEDNDKFYCEIYDETGEYLVIRRGTLKQVGSSNTYKFSFDEQFQKVVMYSGRKYSITFFDRNGVAAVPLTIDSFNISKDYKAVSTGGYKHDDVTGENNPIYKWT